MKQIPLYKPFYDKAEKDAVFNVLKSGKLSRSKELISFEKNFAKYVNKKYAIAVNSGTSGLHLAVRALGLKEGDEVITTPFSFIASSNVLLYEHIKPIFADIDPNTFNIDPKEVVKKINSKTKAILIVHIFGLPCYVDEYREISKKYKLPIIEDACEALGKPGTNFKVNTVGELTVYGFYENKQLTTAGEGGIIVTDNKKLAEFCCSARDQGRSNEKNWLEHVIIGHNYRMTEIQAAFGNSQLQKIDRLLNQRKKLADHYNNFLKNIPSIKLPYGNNSTERSWFTYFVTFSNPTLCDRICAELKENKIAFHKYFPEIHLFPAYKEFGYKKGDFPVCEKISNTTIALPFYIELKEKQIEFIAKTIKYVVEKQ